MDNFGGDYIAGTDSNDYTDDLENRMVRHRCLHLSFIFSTHPVLFLSGSFAAYRCSYRDDRALREPV